MSDIKINFLFLNSFLRIESNPLLEKLLDLWLKKSQNIFLGYINIYNNSNKAYWDFQNLLLIEKKLSLFNIKIYYFESINHFYSYSKNKFIYIYGELFLLNTLKSFLIKGQYFIYYNNLLDYNMNIDNYSNKQFKYFANYFIKNLITNPSILNILTIYLKNNLYMPDYSNNLPIDYLLEIHAFSNYFTNQIFLPALGEEIAYVKWLEFKENFLKDYINSRNDFIGPTSNLSYYINSGILNVNKIWSEINELKKNINADYLISIEKFQSELLWREFAYHFYYYNNHFFKIYNNSIYVNNNLLNFEKWKKGETGTPIIDSAMKNLLLNGFMPNRCRMLTSCFLIKNLHYCWTIGAQWFIDNLIDADYVINSFNWQWINGSLKYSMFYKLVLNPWRQTLLFDKDFIYIKKYLKNLIPYKANELKIFHKNNEFYKIYIKEIVDFTESKKKYLETYKESLK